MFFSEQLLFDKSNKDGDLLNHPDLHFVFPLFSDKDDALELSKEWLLYIKNRPFPNILGWKSASNSSGNTPLIRKTQVVSLHKYAKLKSYRKNKVFILWLGELMKEEASTLLLKLFEEPPTDCYFLFVSKNINDVLPTIKSRCQISSLSPIPMKLIEEKIKNRNPGLDAKKIASSSLIRNFLQKGELEKANRILDRKWSIYGKVQRGKQLGKKIGFPTANIDIKDYVLPSPGVYAVRV